MTDDIVRTVLGRYPDTQAIYLFGPYGTENEWPDSDVDIALLLPLEQAKASRTLAMSPLCSELGSLLGKLVYLINLREVSTVFQKEIITADRRIYTGDAYGADEFEMLALSFYQKLGQERADMRTYWRRSGERVELSEHEWSTRCRAFGAAQSGRPRSIAWRETTFGRTIRAKTRQS